MKKIFFLVCALLVSPAAHADRITQMNQNEIDFVTKTVARAYTWLASWKDSSSALLPAQSFGDMVYQACMSQKDL